MVAHAFRWSLGLNVDARNHPHLALLVDSRGKVGTDHFREEYGNDAVAAAKGNLAQFNVLASDFFDPAVVHPTIRAFFERTSTVEVSYIGRQDPCITPIHRLMYGLVFSRMEQLAIPAEWGRQQFMKCTNLMVDTDPSLPGYEYHTWQRTMSDGRPFYTAAISSLSHRCRPNLFGRSHRMTYFLFVLPLPRANLSVAFAPRNLARGGMELTTVESFDDGLAGTYLVKPHYQRRLSYRKLPMREHFIFRPIPDDVVEAGPNAEVAAASTGTPASSRLSVVHSQYWKDILMFQLDYTIVIPPPA